MRFFISKFLNVFQVLGVTDGFVYLIDKCLQMISLKKISIIKYYIMRQPVTVLPRHRSSTNNIVVTEVTRQQYSKETFPRTQSSILARYGQNGRCFAAYRKKRFAGFIWLNVGRYAEDEVNCIFHLTPSHTTAWDYDVYVEPRYRISFVFFRLWEHANRFMLENGITDCYSRISYDNKASLSAHARLGAKIIGVTWFVKLFKIQLYISTGFYPYLAVSVKKPVHIYIQSRQGKAMARRGEIPIRDSE